jgi:hypothetical protein
MDLREVTEIVSKKRKLQQREDGGLLPVQDWPSYRQRTTTPLALQGSRAQDFQIATSRPQRQYRGPSRPPRITFDLDEIFAFGFPQERAATQQQQAQHRPSAYPPQIQANMAKIHDQRVVHHTTKLANDRYAGNTLMINSQEHQDIKRMAIQDAQTWAKGQGQQAQQAESYTMVPAHNRHGSTLSDMALLDQLAPPTISIDPAPVSKQNSFEPGNNQIEIVQGGMPNAKYTDPDRERFIRLGSSPHTYTPPIYRDFAAGLRQQQQQLKNRTSPRSPAFVPSHIDNYDSAAKATRAAQQYFTRDEFSDLDIVSKSSARSSAKTRKTLLFCDSVGISFHYTVSEDRSGSQEAIMCKRLAALSSTCGKIIRDKKEE